MLLKVLVWRVFAVFWLEHGALEMAQRHTVKTLAPLALLR